MAHYFKDMHEALDHIGQQLAELKGEALAARLLGTFAIDLAVSQSPEKAEALKNIANYIDDALNNLELISDGKDDADVNEKIRELARLRAQQALDDVTRHQGF